MFLRRRKVRDMTSLARKLKMVRGTGYAKHHSIEALVVLEGCQPPQTEPFRIEAHDFFKVLRWTRHAQSRSFVHGFRR